LAGRKGTFEDLTEVGSVGLVKAVDRFVPARGQAFVACAAAMILDEIKRHLRDSTGLVGAQCRAHALRGAVLQGREALHRELGRSPAISELAERVAVSAHEVVETIAIDRGRADRSTEEPVATSSDMRQLRVALEEQGCVPTGSRVDLREALAALTDLERSAVLLRFAEGRTHGEIAEATGVSETQVSLLLRRSLRRIRLLLEE
jgi:RNA polymerase sigma-B factor